MRRAGTLVLLLITVLILCLSGLAQRPAKRNKSERTVLPNQAPTASLAVSANTITLPCPPDQLSLSGACESKASTSLQIKTTATDPDGDTLLYSYNVNGGRVTGTGASVNWDLSGLGPGTYTASVNVDDGRGCVTTATTSIAIVNCPDCVIIDVCPTISVTCPSEVEPNHPVIFSASFTQGAPAISETYRWTVSAGTITNGQTTSSISVDTAGLSGQTITATVEVGGIDPTCIRTASCSTPVKLVPPEPERFDAYGNIRFNDEKARLDNFAIQLQNTPDSTGYIVGYGSCNTEGIKRAGRAKRYLVNIRGLDESRVVTVAGGCLPELQMRLWILTPDIKPPVDGLGIISPCPDCQKKRRPRKVADTTRPKTRPVPTVAQMSLGDLSWASIETIGDAPPEK
jgi:hypothetical protein